MGTLSDPQKRMLERLLKAEFDFIVLHGSPEFQTGRSLVSKGLAECISGVGRWGRWVSITSKGIKALETKR